MTYRELLKFLQWVEDEERRLSDMTNSLAKRRNGGGSAALPETEGRTSKEESCESGSRH